jgi:hypothetical protein
MHHPKEQERRRVAQHSDMLRDQNMAGPEVPGIVQQASAGQKYVPHQFR